MKNNKAFTLMELLIVIGIIAILAAAVIIAINPGQQFAAARDATRQRHLSTLNGSVLSYQVAHQGGWGSLNIDGIGNYEICNTNKEGVVCGDLLDLSVLVDENYITQIPVDPQKSITEDDSTGYYLRVTSTDFDLVANFETMPQGMGTFVFEVDIPIGGDEFIFYAENANFMVDWGDDTIENFSGSDYLSHNYDSGGIYAVALEGSASLVSFNGISSPWSGTPEMLYDIPEPISADFGLTSADSMFALIEVESFSAPDFFDEASAFITDMNQMFILASNFNQDISNWNTSNVVDMSAMFYDADSFNGLINSWDTSSVINMAHMFDGATSFDQPLNEWDTSSVEGMYYMFYRADAFNQPLNDWDVSNVLDMSSIFRDAISFNQPLDGWDTSSAEWMGGMFLEATSFNQDIGNWNTSSAEHMGSMFRNATSFNQDIGNWCVELIEAKPLNFDNGAGFESQDHLQPDWGASCI